MLIKQYQSRLLTEGEKALAKSVFGDSLQLDDILLKSTWWVLKGYAVSPDGCIYFHPDDFVKDFSQESVGMRAWLVHELTHVWQIQQGIKVVRKALFNRRYNYKLQINKPFSAYGVEQQARMVEDYYRKRELHQDYEALMAFIPFINNNNPKKTNSDETILA